MTVDTPPELRTPWCCPECGAYFLAADGLDRHRVETHGVTADTQPIPNAAAEVLQQAMAKAWTESAVTVLRAAAEGLRVSMAPALHMLTAEQVAELALKTLNDMADKIEEAGR